MEYSKLIKKVDSLNEVLQNTIDYRKQWDKKIKKLIVKTLKTIIKNSGVKAEVDIHDQVQGLEAVSFALGTVESGLYERVGEDVKKPLVRMNGVLMFQELFNGKISIWINYPFIQGVGEQKSPKMLEIVRPHELKEVNILRYTEEFIDVVKEWEDYDDDVPPTHTSIGFGHPSASLK